VGFAKEVFSVMAITHEQLLDTAACLGTALEKAETIRRNAEQLQEKVASAVPDASKALLQSGLIEGHEKEALARVLADHEQTLKLMAKIARHYHQFSAETTPPTSMGQPVTQEKRAGQEEFNHYPGQRTAGMRESDRLWYKLVTGTVPS